jgi:DNA invertase Pin-like site-specific DNA recombinase
VGRKFAAYYLVGDDDELEAQVHCVREHVRERKGVIGRAYHDDAKRRLRERPGLRNALDYAKRNKAALIIATLKGLSRDVVFFRALRDSGVDFVVCDLPDANTSTIRVLTALAEYDARVVSERSRKALAGYKANGGKLGAARPEGRNLSAEARAKGTRVAAKVARAKADQAYRDLAPFVLKLREDGMTLQQVADQLNADGYKTRRGFRWNAMQVSRVLKRRTTT